METFFPLVLSFTRRDESSVTFNRLDGLVHIPNPDGLTWLFATQCTGQSSYKEIRASFADDKKEMVDKIFSLLRQEKLVQDARMLYRAFHQWSSIPLLTSFGLSEQEIVEVSTAEPWFPAVSSKMALPEVKGLPTRTSSRNFTGERITLEELSSMLASMCSKSAIPSAGGFYPLVVYVAVFRVEGMNPGLYAYEASTHSLAVVLDDLPEEKIVAIMGNRIVERSAAVLFVTANVDRVAQKYSNRAYRFVLLEAGHAMQNAYLFASGTRVGVCEYGGFLDNETTELLGLDAGSEKPLPLIAMLVGVRSEEELASDTYEALFKSLEPWLKSRNFIDSVHYALRSVEGYRMSVYAAETAKKYDDREEVQLGTGLTSFEAMAKALAEAYERYVSTRVRVDTEASQIQEVFDLNHISSQKEEYRLRENLSEDPPKHFVIGRRYSGGAVKVPVDQVFYPFDWGDLGAPGYYANSTGVAAYTDEEIATHKAAFELIERDAIAAHWYGRKTPKRIDPDTCSSWIRYRVKAIRAMGREVVFLRLTLDLTPVAACIITGSSYPYYVLGGASAATHAEAIEKSLSEAEITLTSFLGVERTRIKPEDVVTVDDHGTHAAYLKEEDISWMLASKSLSLAEVDAQVVGIQEALRALDPVVVRLDDPATDFMPVVRVLSEKLLPITFGYGSEHYGHPRLSALGLRWEHYPALPHPLA